MCNAEQGGRRSNGDGVVCTVGPAAAEAAVSPAALLRAEASLLPAQELRPGQALHGHQAPQGQVSEEHDVVSGVATRRFSREKLGSRKRWWRQLPLIFIKGMYLQELTNNGDDDIYLCIYIEGMLS